MLSRVEVWQNESFLFLLQDIKSENGLLKKAASV